MLPLLTHDAVRVVQPFFLIVVFGVAAEMIWSALFTPIAAVNRHRGVTLGFVAVAGEAALALCHVLVGALGLTGSRRRIARRAWRDDPAVPWLEATRASWRVAPLFIGLAAGGHGGIQGFNRRVCAALSRLNRPVTTLMLADDPRTGDGFGGDRLRFTRAILAYARTAGILLVGHINLLPFALLYRLSNPRGRVVVFAHGIEVWGDPAYRVVRWWEPALLRRVVERVAVVSGYSRGLMARAFDLPLSRFTLFPNAVDLPPQPQPAQPQPPRAAAGSTILAVTRLGAGSVRRTSMR